MSETDLVRSVVNRYETAAGIRDLASKLQLTTGEGDNPKDLAQRLVAEATLSGKLEALRAELTHPRRKSVSSAVKAVNTILLATFLSLVIIGLPKAIPWLEVELATIGGVLVTAWGIYKIIDERGIPAFLAYLVARPGRSAWLVGLLTATGGLILLLTYLLPPPRSALLLLMQGGTLLGALQRGGRIDVQLNGVSVGEIANDDVTSIYIGKPTCRTKWLLREKTGLTEIAETWMMREDGTKSHSPEDVAKRVKTWTNSPQFLSVAAPRSKSRLRVVVANVPGTRVCLVDPETGQWSWEHDVAVGKEIKPFILIGKSQGQACGSQ